jgi:hypothetical protein
MNEVELKASYRDARARLMSGKPVNKRAVVQNEHPARDHMRTLTDRAKDAPKAHVPIQFMLMPAVDDPTVPKWKRIALEVCFANSVTFRELLSFSRSRHIVNVRHEVMWRLATDTDMSLSAIGRRLSRDHTSALHGVRAHAKRNGLHNPYPYQDRDATGRQSRARTERVSLPKPDLDAWINLGAVNA